MKWKNIDFLSYDLILTHPFIDYEFITYLYYNYESSVLSKSFKTAIESETVMDQLKNKGKKIYPLQERIKKYIIPKEQLEKIQKHEIFISQSEREWGNNWLLENGIQENQELVIFLDSSSYRTKILLLDEYFKLIKWFLSKQNNVLLVFDENKQGKKELYKEWLDEELFKKIFFFIGLPLRKALCIISSKFTKIIFGPSTGLLHCASGIYNVLAYRKIIKKEEIPLMFAYISKVDNKNFNEWFWWEHSLVHPFIIRKDSQNNKIIKKLHDCPRDTELFQKDSLYAKDYSAKLILDYFVSNYQSEFANEYSF